jgi:hypothetical protein
MKPRFDIKLDSKDLVKDTFNGIYAILYAAQANPWGSLFVGSVLAGILWTTQVVWKQKTPEVEKPPVRVTPLAEDAEQKTFEFEVN